MRAVRVFCITLVLLISNLSASAQQIPWKGTFDNLSEFESILDLSDEETARQLFYGSLSDPSIQFESVAIHAYRYEEACGSSFFWRRLANDYGALRLSVIDESSIQKQWFNELDKACDPISLQQGGLLCHQGHNGPERECEIARDLIAAARGGSGDQTTDHFVFTTAPLPYASQLAEIRGQCELNADRPGFNAIDSACYRKLSLQ